MKYRVEENKAAAIDENTTVYQVTWLDERFYDGTDHAQVWWNKSANRGNCCNCSGPLSAMSSSCAHVMAVKRHIAKLSSPSQANQ